ncbi:hypothetical protein FWG76_01165 [Candidatus Saccharibacteria bacterium]|nr:hypothetical protein [Candidatus Saccharibacteria bacterium]
MPGSKLNAMKSGGAKPPVVAKVTASNSPKITVLRTPSRVVGPAPKPVTTFATPTPAAMITPTAAETAKASGFKRPSISPRPVDKPMGTPVDKPVRKSVEKPVDNSAKLSVILEKQSENTKPIKTYAIAKRKVWAGLAFAGFAVAITGFLVYLNLPDISVRVRASELGISTNLPAFKPEGYRVQGMAEVENDILTVRYASGDDSYVFTARRSSLDPMQMTDYANSVFKNPDSLFGSGLTIYIEGSDAIWANGGVLYTITGSNALTNEQIIKIAIATE